MKEQVKFSDKKTIEAYIRVNDDAQIVVEITCSDPDVIVDNFPPLSRALPFQIASRILALRSLEDHN